MGWVGFAVELLGLILFLLKQYYGGAEVRSAAQKAREIASDGEAEADAFRGDLRRGESESAGAVLDGVLSDLDALC